MCFFTKFHTDGHFTVRPKSQAQNLIGCFTCDEIQLILAYYFFLIIVLAISNKLALPVL